MTSLQVKQFLKIYRRCTQPKYTVKITNSGYYFLHIMVVCVCLSFIVYLLWFAAFVANKDIYITKFIFIPKYASNKSLEKICQHTAENLQKNQILTQYF